MPFAKVEVAEVEVILRALDSMPPVKVEVAAPCTRRLPVVVAPPEMVSPPSCVPFPIVVDAVERRPWVKEIVVDVAFDGKRYPKFA